MPLYDYVCEAGHKFESLAVPNETKLCSCGADAERQFPKRANIVWGQGAALVDVYDKDADSMRANGELNGN